MVIADESGEPDRKKRKLSPGLRRALEMLVNAINVAGQIPPAANGHIPTNTHCVTEDLWREYFFKGAVSDTSYDRHAHGL